MNEVKQQVLEVVNEFPSPRRLSWVIKAFNAKGVTPYEPDLKNALDELTEEGKIYMEKNPLGNKEYAPIGYQGEST